MNSEPPKIITTNFRINAVLPPTESYRWNRNIQIDVVAEGILEAIAKFSAAYPEAKITNVHKSSDIHIL